MLATFLTNRTMTVRVGGSWSRPREVNGGVPQGSILGVFLFNVAVDRLEEGCPEVGGVVEELEELGQAGVGENTVGVVADAAPEQDIVRTSTPERGGGDSMTADLSPVGIGSRYEGEGTRFVFLANACNVGPVLREEVPPEPSPRTSAKWKPRAVRVLKYVDDGLQAEKILSLIHI